MKLLIVHLALGFVLAAAGEAQTPLNAAQNKNNPALGLSTASAQPLALPIVFTQVPASQAPRSAPPGLVPAPPWDQARVVLLAPGGAVRVLSEGFAAACDPDVSFDGQRVLFAGKKAPGARWRLWEVRLDGTGLRPVSPETMEARRPIYATTLFTLNSPQPWFTTVFVGQECPPGAAGSSAPPNLYNVKLDGTELRRLTHTPYASYDPVQMWDGRVVYAAEQHPLEPGQGQARVGLFGIHIEGADMELFGAQAGRRIQHMPCATDRGLVVFVEADEPSWDGSGQLACVRESRPHQSYRRLTQAGAWRWLYPAPAPGGRLLVSRRPADGTGTAALLLFDPEQGATQPLYDSAEYDDVEAKLVAPRAQPDGHSTVVNTLTNSGTFYGLNCYDADERIRPHLSPGTFRKVRFIEGRPNGTTGAAQTGLPAIVPRRLIGEAPVEADGSFNVEVPAGTPILVQALDDRGLALATCGWVWVQPNETRGCIGCHEDPELIPENQYVQALRRPSNRLTLAPDQRRTVTFRDDIVPILQRHCATAKCHGGTDTPLALPLPPPSSAASSAGAAEAYAALRAPGKYIDPGRARTSVLVWQVFGTNTARPWDRAGEQPVARAKAVKSMPPPDSGAKLDAEELRTIVQWIDLGAAYAPENP